MPIKYNMAVNVYSQSGNIDRGERCFAFMFTNLGNTIARVNGMVIFPSTTPGTDLGDSRTISAHAGEEYKGIIRLSFDTPVGNNPLVEIVQLFYAD